MCEGAASFSLKNKGFVISRLPCLVLILLCYSLRSRCQITNDHPTADLYKNFLGHWTGYNESAQKGSVVHTSLDLVVTEEKNGKSMRFDYTYGKKGEKDFERLTRYVELRPTDAVMILRWKGEEKMTYKTDGLERFAQDGFGRFTAEQQRFLSQQKVFDRGTFELQQKTFFYKWERSTDGLHYAVTGVFALARETSATPTTN
jgi:hypothetical protein